MSCCLSSVSRRRVCRRVSVDHRALELMWGGYTHTNTGTDANIDTDTNTDKDTDIDVDTGYTSYV